MQFVTDKHFCIEICKYKAIISNQSHISYYIFWKLTLVISKTQFWVMETICSQKAYE